MSKKLEFRVQGMDCAEEVGLLKRELVPLVGEDSLGFDLLNRKLSVDASDSTTTPSDIEAAIKRSGLTAVLWQDTPTAISQSFWSQHQRTILTATSGFLRCLVMLSSLRLLRLSVQWG